MEMNYKQHYDNLINRAKNRQIIGYKEKHHIIPKCLGGNNSKINLVELTPEEHFVAHQLLVKIYPTERKLVYALSALCMSKNNIRNNKMFGWIKRKNIEARTGIIQTKESNDKRRKSLLGRKTSSGMSGKAHKEESKLQCSLSQTGVMKTTSRTIYAWLKSPTGEEIQFGPLLHECKKYNLILEYVSDLCKGKKESYKGWTFLRLSTDEEKQEKIIYLKTLGLML
jgi:hypothetical protein